MKYIILAVLVALTGCAKSPQKQDFVRVVSQPLPRPTLDIPPVDKLNTRPIEWIVVTPNNADEIFARLQSEGSLPVVFAVTEQGYKNLTLNNSDQLKIILQQQAAINGYRKYYIQVDGIIYEYNQAVEQQDYWTRTYPDGTPRPTPE